MVKPTIVCLCGSTRFLETFEKANREETLAGRIVLSVGMFGHKEGIDMDGPIKKMLDELHLRKIDLADEVLVLNQKTPVCIECGRPCERADYSAFGKHVSSCCRCEYELRPYIGESTKREIEYALSLGKKVRYLEQKEGA